MKNEISEYLYEYSKVSEEIKFASNSVIRLKLLATLKYGEYTMKEINTKTKLSYCSLATNANFLELREWIKRESSKYSLTNIMRLYLDNILEVDNCISLIKNLESFFNGHDISKISDLSLGNIYQLENVEFIEADSTEILKTQNIIENSLKKSQYIKAIFPYSYLDFPNILNEVILKGINIDAIFPEQIIYSLLKKINYKKDNFNYASFKFDSSFLLVITDEIIVLGLYFLDGGFDQQRIITSKSNKAIDWGDDLFENFKKENYLKYSSK